MKKPKLASEVDAFRIEILPSAEKDLDRLPVEVQERTFLRIDSLALNPRPNGVAKLKSKLNSYRIRIGSYRVVYRIVLTPKRIVIESVRHRKDVYRDRGI